MTFVELDNEITTELRKCFGLSAGVADLDIPPYHDHDGTQLGLAVQSTLYYIAGAMMSTLQKLAGRTARTNSSLSEELTVFCARNTVKRADAEADNYFTPQPVSFGLSLLSSLHTRGSSRWSI